MDLYEKAEGRYTFSFLSIWSSREGTILQYSGCDPSPFCRFPSSLQSSPFFYGDSSFLASFFGTDYSSLRGGFGESGVSHSACICSINSWGCQVGAFPYQMCSPCVNKERELSELTALGLDSPRCIIGRVSNIPTALWKPLSWPKIRVSK